MQDNKNYVLYKPQSIFRKWKYAEIIPEVIWTWIAIWIIFFLVMQADKWVILWNIELNLHWYLFLIFYWLLPSRSSDFVIYYLSVSPKFAISSHEVPRNLMFLICLSRDHVIDSGFIKNCAVLMERKCEILHKGMETVNKVRHRISCLN